VASDQATVSGQRGAEVQQLALHLHAQSGAGQALADRAGGVGARGPLGQFERGAVGELEDHAGAR
jgi:hypothetical protein